MVRRKVPRVMLVPPETQSTWLPPISLMVELFTSERSMLSFINKFFGSPIDRKTVQKALEKRVTKTTAKKFVLSILARIPIGKRRKVLWMPLSKRRRHLEAIKLQSPAAGWISSMHSWEVEADGALPLTMAFLESRIEFDLAFRRSLHELKHLAEPERSTRSADVVVDTCCTIYPFGEEAFQKVRDQLVDMYAQGVPKPIQFDRYVDWMARLDFFFSLLAAYEADMALWYLPLLPNDVDSRRLLTSPFSEILSKVIMWRGSDQDDNLGYQVRTPFDLLVERWARKLGEHRGSGPMTMAQIAMYLPDPDPSRTRKSGRTISSETTCGMSPSVKELVLEDEQESALATKVSTLRDWRKGRRRPTVAQLEEFVSKMLGEEWGDGQALVEHGLIALALGDVLNPILSGPCANKVEFDKRYEVVSAYSDYWDSVCRQYVTPKVTAQL